MGFRIDYYAMASATNQLWEDHPEYRNAIKSGINDISTDETGGSTACS